MSALTLVPFHGHTLLTFERKADLRGRNDHADLSCHNSNADHYVVMRPIVDVLGLEWSAQYRRITRDEVLSCVAVMATHQLPGDDQKREHLCLPIDYMHGWLFGISVKRVRPELREQLIMFKRECYRVWGRPAAQAELFPAQGARP